MATGLAGGLTKPYKGMGPAAPTRPGLPAHAPKAAFCLRFSSTRRRLAEKGLTVLGIAISFPDPPLQAGALHKKVPLRARRALAKPPGAELSLVFTLSGRFFAPGGLAAFTACHLPACQQRAFLAGHSGNLQTSTHSPPVLFCSSPQVSLTALLALPAAG